MMEPGMIKDGTKYLPANGTEGRLFTTLWCADCAEELGCEILLDCMAIKDVNHPDYPAEWIWQNDHPICTGFEADLGWGWV
jgi:hypothetical protein